MRRNRTKHQSRSGRTLRQQVSATPMNIAFFELLPILRNLDNAEAEKLLDASAKNSRGRSSLQPQHFYLIRRITVKFDQPNSGCGYS